MFVAVQKDVRPDLIRDYDTLILSKNLHRLFEFFPHPNSSAGIVRTAKNSEMDVLPSPN
jgi:hypothetical protein